MAATISEHVDSRSFTLGKQAVRELIYNIFGAADEDAATTILLATAPGAYKGLALDSLNADPVDGRGVWKGYARYVRLDDQNEFTFSTGGGSQHMTQSIATVASYAPSGLVAPDFKGAIGVSADRVEGVDVPAPEYQWSETHYLPDTIVTYAYRRTLRSLTTRWNNAPFRDCAAGECLLLGVDGTKRGDDLWALTFRFSGSPNATNLSVGGTNIGYTEDDEPYSDLIAGISKLGHDYLWVRYEDEEDTLSYTLVQRPTAVYVERVFHPGDFSLLQIGTT